MGTPAEDRTDGALPTGRDHLQHLQRLRAGLAHTNVSIEAGKVAFVDSVGLLNRLNGQSAAPPRPVHFPQTVANDERSFSPADLAAMADAFARVLRALRLNDLADGLADVVAQKIIALAIRGEGDPIRLRDEVLKSLKDNQAVASGE